MSYSRGSRYESRSSYRRSSYSRYRSRSRSVDSSDAENPGNNLYVTGLSARITDRDLEKHFSTEGEVVDASIVHDPWTRESRGFGFVTMDTVKEADRCIKYLDRSVLEGRVITVEKFVEDFVDINRVDVGSCSATNSYNLNQRVVCPALQREDEVEPQHLGSILAQNHHVDGGIPQATHLFGGTVTVHDTHGLILLIVDADHAPPMIEGDHTPPTTDEDHTPPMIGVSHTRLTTAVGTVQDLRTATEDRGHLHMTIPLHHTTAGVGIDLCPGHPVLLQGPETGAIPTVYHHREAILEAVPQCQKDQRAILQRKGIVEGNPHAADLLARVVVQGKAILTAAVRTLGLSLGSAQLELEVCPR